MKSRELPHRALPGLAAALLTACASPGDLRSASEESAAERPEPPYVLVENEPLYTLLPLDGIPSIDEPEFVTAAEVGTMLQPEELVLGVIGRDGTAKAYSAWQLDSHEIVNDRLDGEPIAVTW